MGITLQAPNMEIASNSYHRMLLRKLNWCGLLAVLGTVVVFYLTLPIGTAVQFGGDEGYKLMTAFLMSKGYVLYAQIWSDQPPVLVLLLSWIFKWFGPSILLARLTAASFGLLLFGSFYWAVNMRLGVFPAVIASAFLLASPFVLELSVSVMPEVPAFAVALLALVLLFQWRRRQHWLWIIASGSMMGLALGIKFSAALVLPAMLLEILAVVRNSHIPGGRRGAIVHVLLWALVLGLVVTSISMIWARGSWEFASRSHFSPGWPKASGFPSRLLLHHSEGVILATLGLVFVLRHSRFQDFVSPLSMLVTALLVHSVHRPWWMSYYLHLAIPLAWLAGFATDKLIISVSQLFRSGHFDLGAAITWGRIQAVILLSFVFFCFETRLATTIKDLQGRSRVDSDPIIGKLAEHAKQTRWAYVSEGMEAYLFHLGIPVPPELAVVSLKRFWSRQITAQEIVEINRRYHTDQILLNNTSPRDEWRDELNAHYVVAYQDRDRTLFLRKPDLTNM